MNTEELTGFEKAEENRIMAALFNALNQRLTPEDRALLEAHKGKVGALFQQAKTADPHALAQIAQKLLAEERVVADETTHAKDHQPRESLA